MDMLEVFLIVIFGVPIISLLLVRPLLTLLHTDPAVFGGAQTYLYVQFGGSLIIIAYNLAASVLRCLGDSRTPLFAIIAASFANIALDLLFVMGVGWGIFGASFATVLAQLIAFLLCLRSLRRLPLRFAFWLFWGSCALRMTGAAGAAGVLRAGRSGVASGALTKWGSNLGWALLPRAGAAFSRRARGAAAALGAFAPRLLARRALRAPRFVLLSCISVSSFFGFAGTAFFAAFGSCFGAGAAVFAAFAGAVSACFFGASA